MKGRRKGGVSKSAFVCVCAQLCLFAALWTVACQTPLSMGFSRREYWNVFAISSSRNLPTQGSNQRLLCLLHWQAGSLLLSHLGSPKVLYSLPKKKKHWFCFFFFKLRTHGAHIHHSYKSIYSYSFLSVLKTRVLSHFIP